MLVGILGLGSIGTRHARNLMDLGHQVIAHDPNQLSSKREDVIKQADAVVICTPTKRHAHDLSDVLQARKHVLVEKPIGYDCPPYIAGMIMGARSQKKDLIVATGFMLRFHPLVIGTKALITDGHFGEIKKASFRVKQYTSKPLYLRDGVIRNWMSHEIDLARHLLGDLYAESYDSGMFQTETENGIDHLDVSAKIDFRTVETDALVEIDADYFSDPEIRDLRLSGSNQAYKDFHLSLVQEDAKWNEVYKNEIKAFLRAIDGKDPGPLADGYDGVAALELVMQARKLAGCDEEEIQVRGVREGM